MSTTVLMDRNSKSQFLLGCLFLALSLFLQFRHAQAQTKDVVLLTTVDKVVQEGDDFATAQLANPWDFTEQADVGWDYEFNTDSITVKNGVWKAQVEPIGSPDLSTNGEIAPLFKGYPDATLAEGLQTDRTLPRYGINHPIDAERYSFLSFKMKHTDRSYLLLWWEDDFDKYSPYQDENSPSIVIEDGLNWSNGFIENSGWKVYSVDLTKPDTSNSSAFGQWSDIAYSLHMLPSLNAASGSTFEIDWLRLVDPLSAPLHSISWSIPAGTPFAPFRETLFVDTDASGYNGTPLVDRVKEGSLSSFLDGNGALAGRITFPTAALPPGTYYFYVEITNLANNTVHQSGYSAELRINARPSVAFVTPSEASAADYATSELANTWDMADEADITNLYSDTIAELPRGFENAELAASSEAELGGTVFKATTLKRDIASTSTEGDTTLDPPPLLMLNTGNQQSIDPSRYRYLTYRIKADNIHGLSTDEQLTQDWVSGLGFWTVDPQDGIDSAFGSQVKNGWHTYTIDLWDPRSMGGLLWKDFYRITRLAFSPLGAFDPTTFEIDWVRLTEENYTLNNLYTLVFELNDTDNFTLNVELYYDTDRQGFDGTLITRWDNLTTGRHSYTWDTSALKPSLKYYPYLVVKDALNTTMTYASVPIRIERHVSSTQKAPFDYDGDGKSDRVVHRASTGQFFQWRSSQGQLYVPWVAGQQFTPCSGDFDGDGITDICLRFEYYGYHAWYIFYSKTNEVKGTVWGLAHSTPVVADYDGDGKDELAVYDAGTWFILDELNGPIVRAWGLETDIPVPADFDGDGKADVAIWRPEDGTWWILNSGYAEGFALDFFSTFQWGLPSDTPFAKDFNSDGKADLGVWRAADGYWFVHSLNSDWLGLWQWGLDGDQPFFGDFNGDGFLDLTVYRPSTGHWFHNYRNLSWDMIHWGLDGDTLPE